MCPPVLVLMDPDARRPRRRRAASGVVAWSVACALLAGSAPCVGQPVAGDGGLPFIVSYSPQDYQAHSQNWAAAQDPRGVMYFGNGNGVLEFDGVRWHLIPVANQSIVRSLAVDESGTVWVGAVGELGYLGRTPRGSSVTFP